MVDFTQWGSAGHGRENVAAAKGIWTPGEFVSGNEPYTFTGNGSQHGANFWTGAIANNDPSDLSITSADIDENQTLGTLVGNLTTTDADSGDTHTYSLVAGTSDADNGQFQISGNSLQSKVVFNFESKNSYTIRIQTDDGKGGAFSKSLSITINDTNDTPTSISISNDRILENQDIGTSIGTLSSQDEDASDTHTYSLVAGTSDADNGQFQISGNSLQSKAVFNFKSKSSYIIRIQTDDGNGGLFETQFTISITEIVIPTVSASIEQDAEKDFPGLIITRLKMAANADPAASYTIEISADLASWKIATQDNGGSSVDTYTLVSITDNDSDGTETIRLRYNVDFSSLPNEQNFFRAKVKE